MLTFPECGNRLCRLLNAAYTDAFEEGRPVVLILRRRRSDRNALIILFGEALADDSRMRYGNCLMFVEENEITYTMVPQTEETKSTEAIHEEFARLDFAHVAGDDITWASLLRNCECKISDVRALLGR
ncbi:hypothetical protein ANCCAN_28703 [Ancylostoma caninum]|uniref:Uncharacterized protein n=1 Tax=Ancylostoma caninum TaxID=29170 RepID=A0A368F0H9_ANCCA|nr:hypothetical protein ANCCAN_28703 [Ancylostoma caninum]